MIERVPPQNIEAEQAVIGGMLIEKEAISKVAEFLKADDFYREAHRLIFEAMLELFNKNEAVDLVTVTEVLRKNDKLEAVGGIAYITSLANSVPTAANINYHGKIVEEKALLRGLINSATHIASMGYEDTEAVADIIDKAEKMILEVSERKMSGDFVPIKSIIFDAFGKIEQLYASKGGITGLATGFKDLDKITSGLQPSDLILVAARPSMGKTAFTLNIASHVAIREKKAVAFFSLEMSKEQLVQRMLCSEATIDSQRLRIGELEERDWTKLISAADRLSSAPIYIDDTPGITVMEMRSKARRLKIEHDLQLIIIDYLQLMQGSSNKGGDNRQQEISEISRSLKALARELNLPVIALSQLSRSVESRQIKKPMLSDLRESGSLEQDADIVSFLYREDYYNPETENKNITDIIIAKHRNGPVDTVQLFFHKQFTKFCDLSRVQE
ncbi:MAG: replicative DNA helicase [Negativicutes bacterium]|nr:replicative DNA helicase [Negativicutes bacterium]MBP8629818.1 replicative DNA helicase [Negativicutes bacterium]MBP9537658.1 replicative DNA helicase [Negativicutes bacterium]MBP9949896.1 replicative DNA helicase [Negativicutes bacterium]